MSVVKMIRNAASAGLIGLLSASAACCDEFQVSENWSILIAPAVKATPPGAHTAPVKSEQACCESRPVVDPSEYSRVFNSIPFNRAEYNANPSYRHDAAMEILTGNPRHQTIVKHTNYRPQPIAAPIQAVPYRYNNPNRGLNYYFYGPYWNFRGI